MMFDDLTTPVIIVVLTVASTVWWFRVSLEKVIEKLSVMEQDLKHHTNEERIHNAKGDVEHRALKDQLNRIEENTK